MSSLLVSLPCSLCPSLPAPRVPSRAFIPPLTIPFPTIPKPPAVPTGAFPKNLPEHLPAFFLPSPSLSIPPRPPGAIFSPLSPGKGVYELSKRRSIPRSPPVPGFSRSCLSSGTSEDGGKVGNGRSSQGRAGKPRENGTGVTPKSPGVPRVELCWRGGHTPGWKSAGNKRWNLGSFPISCPPPALPGSQGCPGSAGAEGQRAREAPGSRSGRARSRDRVPGEGG